MLVGEGRVTFCQVRQRSETKRVDDFAARDLAVARAPGACGRMPGCDSTNAQGAKARAISTSAVITAGSSKAITKSVVAAIKIITTTRAQKLSSSINRRIGLAIMELMIAIKRHQLEGVA